MAQAIETQAVVWLGCLSAPLLPLVGLLNITVSFEVISRTSLCMQLHIAAQVKRLLAWALYAPPDAPCSASRTSTASYGLMLLALLLCSCMAVFQLRWEGRRCGPMAPGQSIVQLFRDALQRRPAYDAVVTICRLTR